MSANGRLSPSVASQLPSTTELAGRKLRQVKFCNGELMGKKVNMTPKYKGTINKSAKQNICMSVSINIAGESKVNLNLLFLI